MIYINLSVILIYIMLAVFSRKNHSKYKGNIIKGMAEFVYMKTQNRVEFDKFKIGLRKIHIVSPKELDQVFKKRIIDTLALCLGMFFMFNLVSLAVCVKEKYFSQNVNLVEREGYEGDIKQQELYLEFNGQEATYSLEVNQLQYSEEEFIQISENMFIELEESILGDNTSLQAVGFDLSLPQEDTNGIFEIKWKTDSPEILTSRGRVNTQDIIGEKKVCLTAVVTYLDYMNTHVYEIVVCPKRDDARLDYETSVGLILDKLEKENRDIQIFEIPTNINGVDIYMTKNAKNKGTIIFIAGIFISGILMFLDRSKVMEAGKKRDSMLKEKYPAFVNKLWLLLGTGMTIKAAFEEIIRQSEKENFLVKELEYTINQINSGVDEEIAYLDFGMRIDISTYKRLMGHVSQNLRMGTKDLLRLMEDEVRAALELKKELTRRKGEEASTKLLFPMIILLVTVMIIIIVPAMVTF